MAKRQRLSPKKLSRPASAADSHAAPTPPGPSLRDRIQKEIGEAPIKDSLAAVAWMLQSLAVSAAHLLESEAPDKDKLGGLLKIADRMAKLRDPDRLYQAEQKVRGAKQQQDEKQPGPEMTDAQDANHAAGTIAARRGRPSRRSLS